MENSRPTLAARSVSVAGVAGHGEYRGLCDELVGWRAGGFVRVLRRVPFRPRLSCTNHQKARFSNAASHTISRIMFGDFLNRLTRPDPDPLPETDARLALAALLVRVARSDGDYAGEERRRIDRILTTRYELSAFEAVALRGEAETLESEAPDTVRFTRAIKDAVSYEEREAVIEALWGVVLADGARDHEEDALLRLVSNLLGVNDRDSNLARQRVEAREG